VCVCVCVAQALKVLYLVSQCSAFTPYIVC
jgi:hypothetical protein